MAKVLLSSLVDSCNVRNARDVRLGCPGISLAQVVEHTTTDDEPGVYLSCDDAVLNGGKLFFRLGAPGDVVSPEITGDMRRIACALAELSEAIHTIVDPLDGAGE